MTKRAQELDRQIAKQRKWIAEHGGDLAGYIKRYGFTGVGDGGHAIYCADLAYLKRLMIERQHA
jgi:hypothetical protein